MDIVIDQPSSASQPPNTIQLNNNVPPGDKHKNSHTNKKTLFGIGILFCVISGCLFSLNGLVAKLITSIDPLQMALSRCMLQFCILLPFISYKCYIGKMDIIGPPRMFKFLILRGFTGSTAAIFLYEAIARLSLGDAITISFSNSVITSFLAYFILGESLTILDLALAFFTSVGVVLIARPSFLFGGLGADFTPDKVAGVLFAVAAAIMASITFVTVRKLGKKTPALLNITYYSFCGSFTSSVVLAASGLFKYPCFHELPHVFLLGILGLFAQLFLIMSLQYERASTVAIVRTLQIVFIFFLQVNVLVLIWYEL